MDSDQNYVPKVEGIVIQSSWLKRNDLRVNYDEYIMNAMKLM